MTPKSKKGMEMIWIIIWLVIGLIVAVVLIGMFTGKIQLFGKSGEQITEGTKSTICSQSGGSCVTSPCPEKTTKKTRLGGWIDCTGDEICCVPDVAS